tara:strand:+ start:146 stop:712 length:567 start_codon:yes stop_codon:yes gene_type:complete
MALTLNGSTNTIGGLAVGGLPDGTVDADTLAAGVGGKFASYAIIGDVKSTGTNGGTFSSGDWRTRDLNTEISDADGIVSISSNQFTLAAGSYQIKFSAPAFNTNANQARLYNATTSTGLQVAQAAFVNGASGHVQTSSVGSARVTISGSTAFEIQHRCNNTSATYGFGVSSNYSTDVIYTLVEIFKEA